jgi:hypothetical protein
MIGITYGKLKQHDLVFKRWRDDAKYWRLDVTPHSGWYKKNAKLMYLPQHAN